MQNETEEEYEPPDGYTFLQAAGEIDAHAEGGRYLHALRCGKALLRASRLNGSFKKLPKELRVSLYLIADATEKDEVSPILAELAKKLMQPEKLDEQERIKMREMCSLLSKTWPMAPLKLLS